jgi:hypothetical protein
MKIHHDAQPDDGGDSVELIEPEIPRMAVLQF